MDKNNFNFNGASFPDNFFWGAATSAHQVEGNNHNDWSEREKSEKRIKYLKKRGLNPDDFISGKACDHYNRYEEDFDIAKSLGHNAHRFSIEWSRIEQEEGKFNQDEIEHYRKVIRALKFRGLEPFVTLWHTTFPIWLSRKGGWLCRDASFYFSRYAEKITSEFKGDVKFWITINEPEYYTFQSYLRGHWIPQNRSVFKFFRVMNKLAESHVETYKKIKQICPESQVGIVMNHTYYSRLFWWCPFEWAIAKFLTYINNDLFSKKIKGNFDFIGLNYYSEVKIDPLKILPLPEGEAGGGRSSSNKTDMGWSIFPKGIYYILLDLKKYNKPIYITENGIADAKDEKREKFIKDHLYWISRAMADGVDVRGYFYWSLLDNFEWTEGYAPKFGLVEADYKTGERKLRKSASTFPIL